MYVTLQAYINNLNAAMEKLADAEAKGDVSAIVQLQAAIKFNGGGHLNHSIFWKASKKGLTAENAADNCTRVKLPPAASLPLCCVPSSISHGERRRHRITLLCCT